MKQSKLTKTFATEQEILEFAEIFAKNLNSIKTVNSEKPINSHNSNLRSSLIIFSNRSVVSLHFCFNSDSLI